MWKPPTALCGMQILKPFTSYYANTESMTKPSAMPNLLRKDEQWNLSLFKKTNPKPPPTWNKNFSISFYPLAQNEVSVERHEMD